MSTKADLEQILEAALSTTEAGNVNFNVLRGFLLEILNHLGIRRKTILISDESDDFKTVFELIQDGALENRGQSPLDLDMIQEGSPQDMGGGSAKRSLSAYSKGSDGRTTPVKGDSGSEAGFTSPDQTQKTKSPVLSVTPPPPQSNSPRSGGKSAGNSFIHNGQRSTSNILKTSSRSCHSLDNSGVRGELKTIKKVLLDLQSRMEALENPTSPIKVRSTASMFLQGDSKTPASDMFEVINIERKVEASDSKLQGLSEMIDFLSTEINEVKDKVVNIENVSNEMETMKDLLKELESNSDRQQVETRIVHPEVVVDKKEEKEEHIQAMIIKEKTKHDDMRKKLENVIAELKSLTTQVHAYKHDAERKIQHEISQLASTFMQSKEDKDAPPLVISNEPPKEVYEALDKCEEIQESQAQIENTVKNVEERVEVLETFSKKSSQDTSASSVFIKQLRSEFEDMDKKIEEGFKELNQSLQRIDDEKKNLSKKVNENTLLLPQVQNNQKILEKEIETINSALQALMAEKEDLKTHSMHRTRTRSFADGSEDISLIRTMIFDLQEEKDQLKHVNKGILEQIYLKQKGLDDLNEQLATIQAIKADKDIVTNEIKFKADKRDVELKVEREDFDRYIGLFDQSLRDLLQRLEGLEKVLRETMDNVSGHIKTKLDKAEVEPLKNFLEERLKAYKPKPIDVHPPTEEYAAGFRKVLIKNFSCISCDRPVEFARDGMFPPLPSTQPMPIKRSNRPYTTYELDQVRQHMIRGGLEVEQERFEAIDNRRKRLQNELLKLSGTQNIEQLSEVIDRPCGGSHTLSFPHSRSIIRGLHLNKEEMILQTNETTFKSLQNVDIMGQDGHIYKGLVEDAPVNLPQISEKPLIPPTVQKEEAGRNRSTTPADEKLLLKDDSNLIA